MSARARQTINSGFGTFVKGDLLRGVPAATVEAWVTAGIATAEPEPERIELGSATLTVHEDGSAEISDVVGNVKLGTTKTPKAPRAARSKSGKATRPVDA